MRAVSGELGFAFIAKWGLMGLFISIPNACLCSVCFSHIPPCPHHNTTHEILGLHSWVDSSSSRLVSSSLSFLCLLLLLPPPSHTPQQATRSPPFRFESDSPAMHALHKHRNDAVFPKTLLFFPCSSLFSIPSLPPRNNKTYQEKKEE
ncbi:hypothetical protein MLD38_033671 [Melastoma candidum]|uniref:Uncharacterized protein n=1 Tax=Melastoma candidum TaxID=119954 RepID=A0ACB9MBW0_9MYRT|nr:hypothetical protein MLD38_033671 [Melastoma candidum]